MSDSESLVVPVGAFLTALGLGGSALWKGGTLAGTVQEHGRRLGSIEEDAKKNVTRAELDARFATIDAKIDKVLAILAERDA